MRPRKRLRFGTAALTRAPFSQRYIFEEFRDPPSGVYQAKLQGRLWASGYARRQQKPMLPSRGLGSFGTPNWPIPLNVLHEFFQGNPLGDDLVFCIVYLVDVFFVSLIGKQMWLMWRIGICENGDI